MFVPNFIPLHPDILAAPSIAFFDKEKKNKVDEEETQHI